MPGVPSGKGCDACRRQKKKCDEAKPTCSRCARRGIECVGAGEQRYKFKVEYPTNTGRKRAPARRQQVKKQNDVRQGLIQVIAVAPSNSVMLLGQALVASIKPATDLRYNLVWAYGGYLAMVPQRLGNNEALDTAVDALVTAHASFSSRREITVSALTKYSRSLLALRTCLDDPWKAGSSETLCAVSILLLVQNLLGFGEVQWTGHCEGAAKILKARKSCKPRDEFERTLLMALRGPVLFEGIFNPSIEFTEEEWKELVENELDGDSPEGMMLRCMAKIPNIMRRAKHNKDGEAGLKLIRDELRPGYNTVRNLCDDFQARLATVETPGALQTTKSIYYHAHYQRMYGLVMTIALYFNFLITGLGGGDVQLRSDSTYLGTEMLNIAENAVMYRPFGAAYVQLGLMAAWLATDNRPLRSLMEQWMNDYRGDFFHQGMGLKQLENALRLVCPAGEMVDDSGLIDFPSVEQATYDGV